MKVIKEGKLKFKARHTCKGCDAVLEYEIEDISYSVSDHQALAQNESNDILGDFYIKCPQCKTLGFLKKLPENVKEAVKNG